MNRIEEIRAREQAATPGKWYEDGWALWDDESDEYVALHDTSADAQFIAHAREDIPYLLSEVDRLTSEIEQYRQQEEEGLLVRMPFPIGSKVYCVHTEGALRWKVTKQVAHGYSESKWQGQINKGKDNRFVICHNSYNHPQAWQLCDVYATEEEAEQAKAGREDKNG